MPTYQYKCVAHGQMTVTKPMAEAGRKEYCPECVRLGSLAVGGPVQEPYKSRMVMTRVWSVPSLIVRPHGYHLRPDEPGYWALDRMQEVGHVPTPDASSHLGAGAPSDEALEADEYAGVPFPQPSEDGMQKLHEVARATFSESGSRL
jgi:hypothetical protein